MPHVTLKTIANNPDIKEGMTREQIDAAIARHADTETLYDQPYEDKKRVRVCRAVHGGEPVAAPRAADRRRESGRHATPSRKPQASTDDFATMILDNLTQGRRAEHASRSERLTFDRLDAFAGEWHPRRRRVHRRRRQDRSACAVSIGPEHGTVGPQQVKEAAKEAVKGVGFDLLIVCGFAFDPHVAEEAETLRQADRAARAR